MRRFDTLSLPVAIQKGKIMKLLTKWQTWYVAGREEEKFHCDLILEPGDEIIIHATNYEGQCRELHIYPIDKFAKVHLSASWELRDTEFEQ